MFQMSAKASSVISLLGDDNPTFEGSPMGFDLAVSPSLFESTTRKHDVKNDVMLSSTIDCNSMERDSSITPQRSSAAPSFAFRPNKRPKLEQTVNVKTRQPTKEEMGMRIMEAEENAWKSFDIAMQS